MSACASAANLNAPAAQLVQVQGSHATHSFSEEEKTAFVKHINETLAGDRHVAAKLPIDPATMEIFQKVGDGLLLCKLINKAIPHTIDERALNVNSPNHFQINENQNLCIMSAAAIGCSVVNIGASDLVSGREHLVLGLIWQIIKIQLLSNIDLKHHPELCRLLEPGESLAALLKLTPEQILIRWFNYHLKRAGSTRTVSNLSGDIKDSECYTVLLQQIGEGKCDNSPMAETDLHRRAEAMLQQANKLDCRKFVTPADVCKGHQRLNLAFTAHLFNTHPGLEPPTEEEKYMAAGLLDDDVGDTREERAFRLWINSLGIDTYVNNLFEDVSDGVVFLQIMDKIRPGIVAWGGVNRNPTSIFKKVENTNYVVLLARQLRFSMVNVGGKDICDKNKKLILGLAWQLMRLHIVTFLKALRPDGGEVNEDFIINWANQRVAARNIPAIANFREPVLKNGLYLLNLLATIEPRAINWDLVTAGATAEDCELNAKYVISVARKVGCCIFLLWEDIVEVKPKMLMTIFGAIMHVSHTYKP
jgi:plastin-1